MPEGPDLGVREADEQVQQGAEEVVVVQEAVLAGGHQDPHQLKQTHPKALPLGPRGAQRVVGRLLAHEEDDERDRCEEEFCF